jgi:hypothetical protein
MMVIIGDRDEMIKMNEIKILFEGARSNVKRLRVIRGGHSSDRDSRIISQISKFCSMIFKLNSIDDGYNSTEDISFLRNNYSQMNSTTNTTVRSITPTRQKPGTSTVFSRNSRINSRMNHTPRRGGRRNRSRTLSRLNQKLDSPLRSPSLSPVLYKRGKMDEGVDMSRYNENMSLHNSEFSHYEEDDENFEMNFNSTNLP